MQKVEGSSPFSRFRESLIQSDRLLSFSWSPTNDRCENLSHERCSDNGELPVWRCALCAHRVASRRRLLPLHSLPASNRDGRLGAGTNRRPYATPTAGRGSAEQLATSRWRPREVLLQRLWLAPVQPQPREPSTDERAYGRLRRGPRGTPELAQLCCLRCTVGADPQRRAGALRGGKAVGS